jgi:DNA-damage-inducible protein D
LHGESNISLEHVENNRAVRKMLDERGVKPERLPAAEDASKVKRKLDGESKKVLKDGKKLKGD